VLRDTDVETAKAYNKAESKRNARDDKKVKVLAQLKVWKIQRDKLADDCKEKHAALQKASQKSFQVLPVLRSSCYVPSYSRFYIGRNMACPNEATAS